MAQNFHEFHEATCNCENIGSQKNHIIDICGQLYTHESRCIYHNRFLKGGLETSSVMAERLIKHITN